MVFAEANDQNPLLVHSVFCRTTGSIMAREIPPRQIKQPVVARCTQGKACPQKPRSCCTVGGEYGGENWRHDRLPDSASNGKAAVVTIAWAFACARRPVAAVSESQRLSLPGIEGCVEQVEAQAD